MDFNKIKYELKSRNIGITEFITDKAKMSIQGFNTAIKNKTLTVVKLEEISKALGVPMTYWFDEEEKRELVFDSFTPYETGAKTIIDQLKKDKENMQMQIDLLLEKLNKCDVEKRKAV